jgi:hypothetical protein
VIGSDLKGLGSRALLSLLLCRRWRGRCWLVARTLHSSAGCFCPAPCNISLKFASLPLISAQALARQVLARGKDIAVLSEELPHVMSSKLKISWQEAADMLEQVCSFCYNCVIFV